MGDYTRMSGYYDLIMTSGYYDYGAIVDALDLSVDVRSVLEIGSGTGLILERLVTRYPALDVDGVDLTPAMLDIARDGRWRTSGWRGLRLSLGSSDGPGVRG